MEDSLADKRTLCNWLSLSGVLAAVFYFLHIVVGSEYYPGYDWVRQAVSDLTAVDSPSYIVASRFSSIYGSLSCLCCVILCLIIRNRTEKALRLGIYLYAVMNWISNIGYALFPLSSSGYSGTFQDLMHFYVVTISVVLLSIASLVLIAIGGLKSRSEKPLAILALLALLCMFFGSIGMNAFPKSLFGLLERFSVYSVVIFTGVLGIYGFVARTEI